MDEPGRTSQVCVTEASTSELAFHSLLARTCKSNSPRDCMSDSCADCAAGPYSNSGANAAEKLQHAQAKAHLAFDIRSRRPVACTLSLRSTVVTRGRTESADASGFNTLYSASSSLAACVRQECQNQRGVQATRGRALSLEASIPCSARALTARAARVRSAAVRARLQLDCTAQRAK